MNDNRKEFLKGMGVVQNFIQDAHNSEDLLVSEKVPDAMQGLVDMMNGFLYYEKELLEELNKTKAENLNLKANYTLNPERHEEIMTAYWKKELDL